MTGGPRLDGRREKALREELLRRAAAMLSADGQDRPPGEVASALIGVAARIGEEVTRRLDRVPEKQVANLFGAIGIGGDPARPARAPVAFRLAEPAPIDLVAPAATRLMASGEAGAISFETERATALAPGTIAAIVAVDATTDRIFLPPDGVIDPLLPRAPAAERKLRGGGGPGTDRLQISLVTGLAPGTILRIGAADKAGEHRIAAIEDELVIIEPPLERTFEDGAPVAVVSDFAPFSGHRDRQRHAFYLGHEALLNVPSALSITMSGVRLPEETRWSWWGGDPAGWQDLAAVQAGGRLVLTKQEGQPVTKEIRGRESLWLRALLPGGSTAAIEARDIRLSVGGSGGDATAAGVEAIANTTPLVLNSAFHPFGREPRLYDSFYIGCAEAFSKPGATISLGFKFAGPELGPLAAVSLDGATQIFSVGKDGLLYRAQLGRDQPRLVPIVPTREQTGGVALAPQAAVAALLVEKTAFVAIAGKGAVNLVQLPFEGPLEPGLLKWSRLASDREEDRIVDVALVSSDGILTLYAQAEKGEVATEDALLRWSKANSEPAFERMKDRRLIPLQGAKPARGGALIVDVDGAAVVEGLPSGPREFATVGAASQWSRAAAWADAAGAGIYIAGYDRDSALNIVRIDRPGEQKVDGERDSGERRPITFEPPPPRSRAGDSSAADDWPTLTLAAATPERFVWDGRNYIEAGAAASIGNSENEGRRVLSAPGWVAVQRKEPGLLYRRATKDGRWAEEHVVRVTGDPLAIASDVPFASEYAAPDGGQNGFGFSLDISAKPGLRLLRKLEGSVGEAVVHGTVSFYHAAAPPEGAVEIEGAIMRLVNDKARQDAAAAAAVATRAMTDVSEAQAALTRARADRSSKEKAASSAKAETEKALDAVTGLTGGASAAQMERIAAQAALQARRSERENAERSLAALPPAPPAAPAPPPASAPAPSTPVPTPTATPEPAPSTPVPTPTATPEPAPSTPVPTPAATPAPAPSPPVPTPAATSEPEPPPPLQPDPREAALKAISDAQDRVDEALEAEKKAQAKVDELLLAEGEIGGKLVAANNRLEAARAAHFTAAGELAAATSAVSNAELALSNANAAKGAAAAAVAAVPHQYILAPGGEAAILLFSDGDRAGLWRLTRKSGDEWDLPEGFPTAAPALRYHLLELDKQLPVTRAIQIEDPEALKRRIEELKPLGEAGRLRSSRDPDVVISAVETFGDTEVIAYPSGSPNGGSVLLTTAVDDWSALGPAQPPNPALSWEYWNGDSWWALDGTELVDRTSNLLVDGIVSFAVPADLAETDVGGRTNHWIRARLVGGDYGEAQVSVKSVPGAGGATLQTVERDMTTIRAPYVTSLRLGFRAENEVPPRFILTEDSLGVIDQAPANLAGLPFKVFTPVGAAMMADGAPSARFERGLMIAFAKPVRGDPVSLYVDAAPGGPAATLIAEIYRDGRFERIQVRDETRALSEPGMIQLSLQRAPDQAEFFGTTGHWVRLGPSAAAQGWLPRIRAVHLNAAYARSVETRELESLGHSSGIPAQIFRLAGAPVESGSLELRVAEPLGEDDLLSGTLDVVETAGSKIAHWVRWSEVEDFSAADGLARVFVLDPQSGLIRFGDARRGAIPPLGAELFAMLYRCVAGEAGNMVAPGASLQLVSPLAGIEEVTALDAAAGGSDAETGERARRRGTAKLRHGERIVTLADLEDHVLARSPAIAQVRAANRGNRVRLMVAAKGPEPRPGQAMLRALERSIREAAGYGIARPGGVDLVAPRLLPLRVKLVLEPDDPDKYIEMADSAEAELVKLFDQAAGGMDGQGWPIGRAPAESDIAAALEPLGRFGTVSIGALERGDRHEPEAFPASIPGDMLVRLDPNDVVSVRRAKEAA